MVPVQNCEVGMLIGYNCPQALAPRDTITGQDDEPFAIKTDLGWTIVGYDDSSSNLINNLIGVLLRYREHPEAIMCDIEKMFHQFQVNKDDRDYLRFLWWEGGDLGNEPKEYRMKVHLFGAASSPGCANYGLKHLASQHENEFPSAAVFIKRNFYVDDGLKSTETEDEARKLVVEARELCARGGMRLHKFVSNSRAVIEDIPSDERSAGVKDVNLKKNDLPMERALGIKWCVESDMFHFHIETKDQTPTRRGILSTVASIYDPLGFLAPFVLIGKGVLQEMCHNGVSWDDPLPDDLRPRWEKWKNDLLNLKQIQIPGCYKPNDFGKVIAVELHHFSDASTRGYGQCSYLRFIGEDKAHCTLVSGKARVAHIKVVTIPRLELTAAVVSVQMSHMLKKELELVIDREYFWTDSQVVLGYILQ
ncbi:uncharacterized protein LOC110976501 [Acanthaster planci]|uniref:Uncharacterized protein LOC110976501 n=1 Tax=Acanthaster planci TaxID=133434 RepID=A0A8B7XXA9_ACAPL|nr:uncharacterized protein LOC110976501 [Acanthaster planci]